MRLVDPTSGHHRASTASDMRRARRRELRACAASMQMIFQDPYASLNPRMTVGDIIARAARVHGSARRASACASGSPSC